ncbi:MAG: trigger factor [Bacteroidales bacterium]|nr:trigger factor [Bacteroidales bacterium]
MNVSKTQSDALNYQVTIEIAAADYAEPLRKRLNEYKRQADIKGFRRGMAPMGLIQRMYGDQALYDAVNRLVGEQLDKFIQDEKIRVLGEPMPSEDQPQLSWTSGSDFTFKFDLAQSPELTFEVSKEDKLPYYDINITAAEKKATREQLLQQFGSLQEGSKVGENDYVIADIENEGHKAEGVYISVSNVAEEARGAFIGKKAGAKFQLDVNVAFPNETDRAAMLKVEKNQLEGLNPLFNFTLVNVKTFVAAEANRETWDKMYGEGAVTTDEQFEEKIVERIKAGHEQEANYRFGADVRKFYVEKAALELPEAFLKRWLIYANEGKFTAEDVEKQFDGFLEDFKWQLVRGRIMQQFGLKVDEADIRGAAESYVAYQYAMYGMAGVPENIIKSSAENMLQDENQRRRLEEQCEDNKAIARVREEVTLQTKKISMDKFRELK